MKQRFLTTLKRFDGELGFLLLLAGVTLAAYGVFLTRMGFYWDDWETVHLARQNSLSAYWSYFQFDRPMMVWTQKLLVSLFGQSPLKWQLFALGMRWLNAVVFYGLLRRLWPTQGWALRWTALLLVVYPGFTQQSLAATYGRYLLISTMLLTSFWLMLQAIQGERWGFWRAAGAIALGILQAVSLEYFVGLELLRPLLVYFGLEDPKRSLRQTLALTLRRWAPYASIPLAFLAYRLWIAPKIFTGGEPHPLVFFDRFAEAPLEAVADFLLSLVQNTVFVSLSVWLQQIQMQALVLPDRSAALAWGGGFAVAVGAAWLTLRLSRSEALPQNAVLLRWIGLSLAILLAGLVPLLLLGRQPIMGKWSDRFTLPVMYGAALLCVTAITGLVGGRTRQAWVAGFLLALALTGQIRQTTLYARDWKDFKEYLWQLSWRVPELSPGTVFIGPDMPFQYMAPYSVAFAVDQIYGSGADLGRPEYWWLELEDFEVYNPSATTKLDFRLRNIQFRAAIRQSVMVVSHELSCVVVLDDFYQGTAALNDDAGVIQMMTALASTNAIQDGAGHSLPEEIFGPEPAHTWCYFYQKADLARQLGDWERVIRIYEEAEERGYAPKNSAERLPLLEAHLQRGEWAEAYTLTEIANKKSTLYNNDAFCRIWQTLPERAADLETAAEEGYLQQLEKVNRLLACDGE